MVRTAVARGLQVILFTCDPGAYGRLGAVTVQLEAVQPAEIPTSSRAATPAQD